MSPGALVTDAVLVAIATALLVLLAPGWAVVGLVAILLLLVCGVSFAVDRIRGRARRRRASPRRAPARRRP